MRLIKNATLLVEEFNQRDVPPYAILSRAWKEDEINLHGSQSKFSQEQEGLCEDTKLLHACMRGRRFSLLYQYLSHRECPPRPQCPIKVDDIAAKLEG